jgi:hypothetical protein
LTCALTKNHPSLSFFLFLFFFFLLYHPPSSVPSGRSERLFSFVNVRSPDRTLEVKNVTMKGKTPF